MRVMVFVKATEDSEKGMEPTREMLDAFAAMDKFTEELVQAGVFIAAAGLKPSAASKRIAFDGARRTVIDGPFAEARDLADFVTPEELATPRQGERGKLGVA